MKLLDSCCISIIYYLWSIVPADQNKGKETFMNYNNSENFAVFGWWECNEVQKKTSDNVHFT